MTREDLVALFRDAESDRVERKASMQSKEILRAICAFANDLPGHHRPGVIFVGVRDDGSCAGLPITDDLLKQLSNLRSEGNLLPLPTLRVEKLEVDGCAVAAVSVEPALAPPARLRGRAYVRVGPTTRQATPEEERRLAEKRRAGDLPFDLRPIPAASLGDLDLELFRRTYLPASLPADILEQNQRSEPTQLLSMRFATASEPPTPTVLGILTLGRDPRRFIPGAYVQFLRIDGKELTDPIKDQREIDGPMPELLARLDEVLKAHISISADLRGDREARLGDYPLVALQQLARNAVLHRNYDGTNAPARLTWFEDRIEISSPGGPYGQVTPETFGEPGVTDYRNPHLAEVLKNLGYVQRFGLGIEMARRELEKNGNPEPLLDARATHVLVTVRRRAS